MNQPPDSYTLLWQELAPLRHLLEQVEVLLGILAGYALLLFSGTAVLLVVAGLSAVLQRTGQRRSALAGPGLRLAPAARSPSRGSPGSRGVPGYVGRSPAS
jgi:hypothetical protein